jgi:hypothetical protein
VRSVRLEKEYYNLLVNNLIEQRLIVNYWFNWEDKHWKNDVLQCSYPSKRKNIQSARAEKKGGVCGIYIHGVDIFPNLEDVASMGWYNWFNTCSISFQAVRSIWA